MPREVTLIEAASIIKDCPRYKLPIVIELLQKAGVEIDTSALEAEKCEAGATRMERRGNKRINEYDEEFWEADNYFTQKMRDAFARGINFTHLSKECGLTRTTLYRYLHGQFLPSPEDEKRVLEAIDKLCPPKM